MLRKIKKQVYMAIIGTLFVLGMLVWAGILGPLQALIFVAAWTLPAAAVLLGATEFGWLLAGFGVSVTLLVLGAILLKLIDDSLGFLFPIILGAASVASVLSYVYGLRKLERVAGRQKSKEDPHEKR